MLTGFKVVYFFFMFAPCRKNGSLHHNLVNAGEIEFAGRAVAVVCSKGKYANVCTCRCECECALNVTEALCGHFFGGHADNGLLVAVRPGLGQLRNGLPRD